MRLELNEQLGKLGEVDVRTNGKPAVGAVLSADRALVWVLNEMEVCKVL